MNTKTPKKREGQWLDCWYRQGLLSWIWPLVVGVLILVVSSLPGSLLPTFRMPYTDKVLHFVIYLGLGCALGMALIRSTNWGQITIVLVTILLCVSYGMADEMYQSTIPGRVSSYWDVLADGLGGTVGGMVSGLGRKIKKAGNDNE